MRRALIIRQDVVTDRGGHDDDEIAGDSIGRQRFVLSLTAASSVCAVVLGSVGVYGMSAYWVARRRRELAIRIAIGASPSSVM